MTKDNQFGSLIPSRRAIVFGGLATVSLGVLSACNSEPESKTTAKQVNKASGDLPENFLGSPDAPITLIEYSSLTCPHCAHFHENTLPELKKKYIDTGKVKYIVREFPLGNLALAAAMLARCAGKDKYFPLLDAMFAKQNEWATSQGGSKKLFEFVKQAGFTQESFTKCLADRDLEKKILAVQRKGNSELGVSSTPTFFVNGAKIEGSRPLAEFEKKFAPILGESEKK